MRVTYLISSSGPTSIERHLLRVIRVLQARGVDGDLVVLGRPGTAAGQVVRAAEQGGIPARAITLHRKLAPATLAALRDHLRQRQPELLHVYGFPAALYGAFAGGAQTRICTQFHEPAAPTGLMRILRRLALRRFAQVIAVSDTVQAELSAFGVPSDRLSVIPFGLAADDLRVGSGARAVTCAEFGIPQAAPLITLHCVLDGDGAGLDAALKAMWHVSVHRADAHLLIVGDGPAQEALTRQAQGYRISERVHFAGWRDDALALLAAADVLLIPCFAVDPSPLLLEAAALGTCVLATAAPGMDALVADGESGLLAPPGDIDHLTSGLSLLLDDPDFRDTLAGAAKDRLAERFPPDRPLEALHALYTRVLGG